LKERVEEKEARVGRERRRPGIGTPEKRWEDTRKDENYKGVRLITEERRRGSAGERGRGGVAEGRIRALGGCWAYRRRELAAASAGESADSPDLRGQEKGRRPA